MFRDDKTKDVRTTADLARERLQGTASVAGEPRPNIGRAIRKGVPRDIRSDFYAFVLLMSWRSFLVGVVTIYLFANIVFAEFYLLEPGMIENARVDSFFDAFFFSVQTMATIGYGKLNPVGGLANVIVVLESVFSLSFTALVTGFIVAKASRPVARVIFSRSAVINVINGKPTLMFRAGNARGSDLVSADMSLTVLKDEFSKEGQHTRRMYDLKLVRSRSPFFSLTWLLMHEIDENSPLAGVYEKRRLDESVVGLMCVMTGHEGTFGQTVYARQMYYPEDIKIGAQFVDVIHQLPDGRFLIDYEKFHELKEA